MLRGFQRVSKEDLALQKAESYRLSFFYRANPFNSSSGFDLPSDQEYFPNGRARTLADMAGTAMVGHSVFAQQPCLPLWVFLILAASLHYGWRGGLFAVAIIYAIDFFPYYVVRKTLENLTHLIHDRAYEVEKEKFEANPAIYIRGAISKATLGAYIERFLEVNGHPESAIELCKNLLSSSIIAQIQEIGVLLAEIKNGLSNYVESETEKRLIRLTIQATPVILTIRSLPHFDDFDDEHDDERFQVDYLDSLAEELLALSEIYKHI